MLVKLCVHEMSSSTKQRELRTVDFGPEDVMGHEAADDVVTYHLHVIGGSLLDEDGYVF